MESSVQNWQLGWDDPPPRLPNPWVWSLLASALLAIPLLLSKQATPSASAAALHALPAGYDLLRNRLLELQAALLPERHAAVLEALRLDPAPLVPPLLWVLARPSHELFGPAAALARDLGLAEAIEPLTEVAHRDGGPGRAAALKALDGLEPLGDDDLAALGPAAMDDTPLADAVLAIVGSRREPSEALLKVALAMLRHRDARIRALVATVLPRRLPETCAAIVLELVDDVEVGEGAAPLLPRLDPAPANLDALADWLAAAQPEQQEVVLATVDQQTATKEVADLAWQLAFADGPLSLRAAALGALERSRDGRPPPESAADWPPMLRYHLARMRIAGGHRDGVQSMVALLSEDAADVETIGAARNALSRMSRLPPHAPTEQFEAWSTDLSEVPVDSLRD